MTVLVRALSRTPAMQQQRATPSTRNTAGRLTVPPSPGGAAIASGSEMPNRESSRSLKVPAPADGDRRDRDAVLEDQVPADDPGDELAERRVAVGVGRAGDRDRRGQLGVGQRARRRTSRRRARSDRTIAGPGVADRLADDHEDAGADDGAEARARSGRARRRRAAGRRCRRSPATSCSRGLAGERARGAWGDGPACARGVRSPVPRRLNRAPVARTVPSGPHYIDGHAALPPRRRLHARRPTSPQAIDGDRRGDPAGERFTTLLGATGTGKTMTMAGVIEAVQRPTLVIAHNKTLAAQLCNEFRTYFPDNAVEYFVSYYDYYQPEAYVPSRGPLHREGLGDQRGDRPPAPRGDRRAVRPARRDHRGVGVGDLRPRLAGDLRREHAGPAQGRRRSTATRCCASSSRSSTRATTRRWGAARSGCAARRWRSSPPTPRPPTARRSSATRSSACSTSTRSPAS